MKQEEILKILNNKSNFSFVLGLPTKERNFINKQVNLLHENLLQYDLSKFPNLPDLIINENISNRTFYPFKNIFNSINKFPNEDERNTEWVECPECGFRAGDLVSHLMRIHKINPRTIPNFNSRATNKSGINAYWKKNPQIKTYEDARIGYKQFMEEHGMIPDINGDKNPNHKSNTSKQERLSRSPKCIEFYEKRYPLLSDTERQEMLSEHIRKTIANTDIYNTRLDYWIDKCDGDLELAKKLYYERQETSSLAGFQKRHGIEEGQKRFDARIEKWQNKIKETFKSGSSRSERDFVYFLMNKIPELCYLPEKDFRTFLNKHRSISFIAKNGKRSHFRPDIVINNKYIIDFFGDYTHGNPELYEPDEIIKFGAQGRTVKEKQDFDNNRKAILESKGYKVLHVWENDFISNPDKVLNTIQEFLHLQ